MQIYQLALRNDPKLQEAEANRNAILETRPQSIAKLLPTVSAAGEVNYNSVLSKFREFELGFIAGGRNIDFWNKTASVTLTQPLYHHESWVQLAQADNQIAEAEATYAAEEQNLMLRTAKAYFDILLAEDTLAFYLAEQRAISRQQKQAKARYDVGFNSITDVNEAQASYDQVVANTIAAKNDLENAKETLREIIGNYSGSLSGLSPDTPFNSPQPNDIKNWSAQALKNNLTIIAAENNAEVTKKNIDLKYSGHLPSLDLVGTAGILDTDRPFGISTEYQVIGVQLKVPLFAGGSVNSQVRQAQQQLTAAQSKLDAQRRAVNRQVKNAFLGVNSAMNQIQALKATVKSSESALKATEMGFELGMRTMVDVLTAQKNHYRSLRDYAKSSYDYIINSLTLKQSASILQLEDLALINHWLNKEASRNLDKNNATD
ncbi:MAG: TolC family outer membrane protein [Methylococcales bacterium]